MADILRNNFTTGEISPELTLRSELDGYANGLSECVNFIPKPEGGMVTRPKFRAALTLTFPPAVGDMMMIPIRSVSSTGAGSLLLLNKDVGIPPVTVGIGLAAVDPDGSLYGGTVLGGMLTDTDSPFREWDFATSFDVTVLAAPGGTPLRVDHPQGATPTGYALNVDVQAQAPAKPTLSAKGSTDSGFSKTYYYCVTAVYKGTGEESYASPVETIAVNPSLSETKYVEISWTHPEPGKVDFYRVFKMEGVDTVTPGWIGDCDGTKFADFNIAPLPSQTPPRKTLSLEKPSAVTFYQQRQVFGGDTGSGAEASPLGITATVIGNYFSTQQRSPILMSDAFKLTMTSTVHSKIEYLVPLQGMIALTNTSEVTVTEGTSGVFTPATASSQSVSAFGCRRVKPLAIGGSILYVSKVAGRLRRIATTTQDRGYSNTDVMVTAGHLVEGERVIQMVATKEPFVLVWALTATGKLYSMTYEEDQGIHAWARHTFDFGGKVTTLAAVETDEGSHLYALAGGKIYHMRVGEMGTGDMIDADSGAYEARATLLPVSGDSVTGYSPKGVYDVRLYTKNMRDTEAALLSEMGETPQYSPLEEAPAYFDTGSPYPLGQEPQPLIRRANLRSNWGPRAQLMVKAREAGTLLAVEYDIDVNS